MYTTVEEVYRISGLDTSAISRDDVTEAIHDAEQEVDEITNTTYYPVLLDSTVTTSTDTTLVDTVQEWTENSWINYAVYIYKGTGEGQIREILSNDSNTLTVDEWDTAPDDTSKYIITYLNKRTTYYDGTNFKHLFVDEYPIVQIDSLEIDGVAVDSDNYYVYNDIGKITLDTGTYTSFFYRHPLGVKVVHHYGVLPILKHSRFDIPREIREFTGLLAALKIIVEQMGGTYNRMSSWTLPNFSGTIGQQYINIEGTAKRIANKIDRMHQRVIGRYAFMR